MLSELASVITLIDDDATLVIWAQVYVDKEERGFFLAAGSLAGLVLLMLRVLNR